MEQFQAVAAQLGLDHTIVPIFGMLVVLYLVLSAVYLRPYQRLLENRKKKTEGARNEAKELERKAEEKMAQYKASIKSAHDGARKVLSDASDEAKREESRVLAEASVRAKNILHDATLELEKQKKTVLSEIRGEIPALASQVAAKVLGRQL
ncbi:MAG: ATP synthase F0 subunit B [Deltaproteobacteria bacterium]|nr:ATP synthase F0 subunit B [Deltaproteobacteria bacterium]